ncbi:MAG TPA: tetratricopeptide repeat protein [Candidatus Acidoferrales bacterium]|nr:tetratricopeptide repeat protein [Candidatus Acidoferrales bacterium]
MKSRSVRPADGDKPRLSLEQKMRLLLRKFRAAEQRRRHREHRPQCPPKLRRLPVMAFPFAALAASAFVLTSQAADPASAFEQANAAFAADNYRAAIAQYEGILTRDGASAPVLFNLGNAHYRADEYGAAILDYERAQVLAPRDHSIAANLQLAREKAGVPAPVLNAAQQLADAVSPNSLAWIGSIALLTLCLTIGIHRFLPRFAKVKAVGVVAALTLLSVVAAFGIRWPEFNRAIVVTATTPARIAPADTAAESFALKAGESITIAKSYGQFILAHTADGRSGWVNDQDIGRVFIPQFGNKKTKPRMIGGLSSETFDQADGGGSGATLAVAANFDNAALLP